MDYTTTIERILAIEKAMDVTAIRYKGVHLWPFVRMQLWQRLLHPQKYAPPAAIGLRRLAQKLSEGFFKPDFYAPYLEHAKRHRSNLSQLAEYGNVDILLYSRDKEHEDVFGGRHYNRHIDPLIDLIKTRYTYLKFELITDQTEQTLPRFEYTHFFDSLDYLKCDAQRSVIAAFQDAGPMPGIEKGRQLTSLLAHTRFDLALTEEYLMMESERLLHYIRYFKELLTVARPRAVFMANYFDNIGMALIAACKSMGIATVDVQCDSQGRHHGMYSLWNTMPEEGYEMLPDFFWCWGKPSVEHILRDQAPQQLQRQALIGGNRWLAKWIEPDMEKLPLDNAVQKLIRQLDGYQKTILVTLQQEDQRIPDIVIETMRKAPADWYWLIRLHPSNRNCIESSTQLLQDLRIENADIERATHYPLYLLMNHCQRHVTPWSSTAVEALRFNVPTVIVSPVGKMRYADHIQKGLFVYASYADQVIEYLSAPAASLVEDPPYIETNRMYAIVALEEIMGSVSELTAPPKQNQPT